jgi:hypothetical protein
MEQFLEESCVINHCQNVEISGVLQKKTSKMSTDTYIVVIFEESLLVGIDPFNWFQLRSLKAYTGISIKIFDN